MSALVTQGHGGHAEVVTPPVRMSALPKRVLDDPIARRWAALYDAAAPGFRWDQRHVEVRLCEAMTLLKRVGGSYGPKQFGTAWPAMAAAIEASHGGSSDDDPVRVTAPMISAMEAALRWPLLYVKGEDRARVLQIWLRCQADGRAFDKALRRRGIADSTGRSRRWQAALQIASGLMEAGERAPDAPPRSRPVAVGPGRSRRPRPRRPYSATRGRPHRTPSGTPSRPPWRAGDPTSPPARS